MKKLFVAIVALLCLSLFLPAAFAGDPEACFQPTLRVGVAFDIQPPLYSFVRNTGTFGGITSTDLNTNADGTVRPYLALSLPFAVTDRFKVALEGDWSFTGSERRLDEQFNGGVAAREFDSDGTSHWVSADFLVSYALVKDAPVIKDLSVVAGLRWDYQTMSFADAHDAFGVLSSPANTLDFRMQSLAPVAGLACTFTGLKRGIWGGDIHLSVLAGPVVWGREDYRETFGNAGVITYRGDIDRGYLVRAFGDLTLLSGKISPRLDGTVSFFAQFTKTNVKGEVDGTLLGLGGPSFSPVDFEADNTVMVLGLSATLLFDICGRPQPVTPPPAPAPVIEPKLEPMSQK
jgi:hypothetical protein